MTIFGLKKKIYFFQQFSSLTKSGIGLLPTLTLLAERSSGRRLKAIVRELKASAQSGLPLATVFEKHADYFGKFPVALMKSGELIGHLPENSQAIADYLEDIYKNINQLIVGLAYPVFLLHLFILISPAGLIFTAGTNAYLHSVAVNLGIVYGLFILLLFIRYLVRKAFKHIYDCVKVYVPVFGKLFRNLSIYKFVRGFNALYQAGLNGVQSWTIAAALTDNAYLEKRILRGTKALNEGKTVASAFQSARIFPAEIIDMVNVGEVSGNMDAMLTKATGYLQEASNRTLQVILRIFPVLAYLLIAGIIAYNIIHGYMKYLDNVTAVLR
jgi:type IV pilus assembly protein PilC